MRQTDLNNSKPGVIPLIPLLLACLAIAMVTVFCHVNQVLLSIMTFGQELLCSAAIVLAAGGFGHLVVRRLAPAGSPTALVLATSCGLGLAILWTMVLVVGSCATGLLQPWLWWPVLGAGVALAIWQGRARLGSLRMPRMLSPWSLAWLLMAVAAAIWLCGMTRTPGYIGLFLQGDSYDVLEYHLQVPRECFDAQHISSMTHNGYSYFPLGTEMLFLLAMSLRGGPYEGMYLATMLHGTLGVLAVATLYLSLRRDEGPRALFGAILLGSVPGLIYLSWLAKTELAQVFYLAVAALWLRSWLTQRSVRGALCIGLLLGAACATKYLSLLFVAAPVLAVMAVASLRRPIRPMPVLLAGAASLALLSPWLIRNAILVGNPVFPLAGDVLGKAYRSDEDELRWKYGHGVQYRPPVPQPAGWTTPPHPSQWQLLWTNLVARAPLSPPVVALAGLAVLAMLVRRSQRSAWRWSLTGMATFQLAAWTVMTHEMPWRFVCPVEVPLALLAGGLLGDLAQARSTETSPRRRRTLALGVTVFVAAAGMNLIVASALYQADTKSMDLGPLDGHDVATQAYPYSIASSLGPRARIMLVGDAKAFYFPAGTIYATVFDPQPLAGIARQNLPPEQSLAQIKKLGVTHIWVDWGEAWRLTGTYGFASPFSQDLQDCWNGGQPPHLQIIEQLRSVGLADVPLDDALTLLARPPWDPKAKPVKWPRMAIYALP